MDVKQLVPEKCLVNRGNKKFTKLWFDPEYEVLLNDKMDRYTYNTAI